MEIPGTKIQTDEIDYFTCYILFSAFVVAVAPSLFSVSSTLHR
jgi:hypothetical protein